MNNIKNMFIATILTLFFCMNANAFTIEISNDIDSLKIADVQWLPDYQSNLEASSVDGGDNTQDPDTSPDPIPDPEPEPEPEAPTSCEDTPDLSGGFPYITNKPTNNTCSEGKVGDFYCYYNCSCSTEYNKTDDICQKENGDGWVANPNDTCGKFSKNCGCTPTLMDGYSTTKPTCKDGYKVETKNNNCGVANYKCVNKSCTDAGFVTACDTGFTGTDVKVGVIIRQKDCKKPEPICKPTCVNATNCPNGTYTKDDGCGNKTCIACLAKCGIRYTYYKDYNPRTDCDVMPYRVVSEVGKSHCKSCVCDNGGTNLQCQYR